MVPLTDMHEVKVAVHLKSRDPARSVADECVLCQRVRQPAGGVNAVRKRSSATVLSPEANASMPTTPV